MNSKNNDVLIIILIIGASLFFTGLPRKKNLLNKNKTKGIATSPIIIPSPTPFQTPSKEIQQWLIATTGVLAVQNKEGLDSLKSQIPLSDLKMLVYEWWGITDRKSALEVINWLKKEGHREQFNLSRHYLFIKTEEYKGNYQKTKKEILSKLSFEEVDRESFLLDFIWQHKDDLENKSLLAWDYMRLNSIARWCYTLELISEQEAWETMLYSSINLQKNYSSWKELGEHYLLGRTFWIGNTNHTDAQNSIFWLKNYSGSPWKKIPWSLELR